MAVDTTPTVEIKGSALKTIGIVALGVPLTGVSAILASGRLEVVRTGNFTSVVTVIGYIGVAFFGLCTFLAIGRLFSSGRPVITISPLGIVDTRVAKQMIPWSSLTAISTWEHQRQKAIIVSVAPAVEAQLELSTIASLTHRANAALGADGLCITAQGLQIDHDNLHATILAYAQNAIDRPAA
jgi:hypothetical protein